MVEFKMQTRPTAGGSMCVVPDDATTLSITNGVTVGNVAITRGKLRHMERLYGFDLDAAARAAATKSHEQHVAALARHEEEKAKATGWDRDRLVPPKRTEPSEVASFQFGGDTRDLLRYAEADGMRMVALIAAYLEPGEDPVRWLAKMLMDQGYDVPVDPEWADTDWPHDDPERAAEPRSDG